MTGLRPTYLSHTNIDASVVVGFAAENHALSATHRDSPVRATHQFDEVASGVGIVVRLQGVEDERCVLSPGWLHDFRRLPLQVLLQALQFLLKELPLSAATV